MRGTRAQNVRLGLFVVAAAALLAAGVGILAGVALFDDRIRYFLVFEDSVAGLDEGAPVRVRGVDKGSVSEIELDEETALVRVVVAVDPDTPIFVGARARLGFLGVTGLRYVDIAPGDPTKPRLERGARIPAEAVPLSELADDLESLATEAARLLANLNAFLDAGNREQLDLLLERLTAIAGYLETLLAEGQGSLQAVLGESVETLNQLQATLASLGGLAQAAQPVVVEAGELFARLDRTVAGLPLDAVMARLNRLLAQLDALVTQTGLQPAVRDFATAAAGLDDLLTEVSTAVTQTTRQAQVLLTSLQRAARDLELLIRQVRAQPSLLLRGRREREP